MREVIPQNDHQTMKLKHVTQTEYTPPSRENTVRQRGKTHYDKMIPGKLLAS